MNPEQINNLDMEQERKIL